MIYEASFSFFIENNDRSRYEKVLSELLDNNVINDLDYYDDGEDFCIDCIAGIEVDDETPEDKVVDAVTDTINNWMTDWYAARDYHYVKGREFYWQP